MLLVTVVTQFTSKTINSEKAIYFFSLMSCSMKKLKSYMLFTFKFLCFPIFRGKKFFAQGNGGGGGTPLPPALPFSIALTLQISEYKHDLSV